ncbi:acetylcholine receptor subunit alpha-like 1 isoform X2 [Apostichopus japonicus]|uniref:acetylcholine receptor subunit alpha-like 1 isoform X2 n=1 Tax=Stichopus japonicus TaxID=307972 RepID=UPI003AB8B65C
MEFKYNSPFQMDCRVWLIVFMTLTTVTGMVPKSFEGEIRDRLLNNANYSSRERPVINASDTVQVDMKMHIHAMIDLNEHDQVLTTAVWISLQWKDLRLSWNASEFGDVTVVPVYVEEIWTPSIFITNALDSDSLSIVSPERGMILLDSDGVATMGTPAVLSTQCPLSIHYFPYDKQVCRYHFLPTNQHNDLVKILTRSQGLLGTYSSLDWTITNLTNYDGELIIPDFTPNIHSGNLSMAVFCLHLERDPSYYIRVLLIPSTLLCILSFLTFFAPPDSGERISLSVSMVLGLTVFQLLVADILPTTLEGSPILSYYLTVNFVLASSTVPISLSNINIAYGDKRLTVLKCLFMRRLLIEYLPRILGVPSYSERINCLNKPNKRRNQLENSDMETKTSESLDGHLDTTEKTKIEARTVALVLDRIASIIFFSVFLLLVIQVIVDFNGNDGPAQILCEETFQIEEPPAKNL